MKLDVASERFTAFFDGCFLLTPEPTGQDTDSSSNTTAVGAARKTFSIVRCAGYGEVLRGVSFTPGSTPEP